MRELADPAAGDGGHFSFGEGGVVGFSFGSDEGGAEGAFPDGGHAFAGVAAPALAEGVFVKGAAVDFAKVFFVNPSLADGHDVAAVVEHEAVSVGVAEEVEGGDVAKAIDGGNGLAASADPDESGFAFGSLFGDPFGVGFAVLPAAELVAVFVDDPGDGGAFAVGFFDFVHAHGGGADEVGPPAVVAIVLDAEVFPFPGGRATAEDDVLTRNQRKRQSEEK